MRYILVALLLTACGGGGGTDQDTSTDPTPDAEDTRLDTTPDTATDPPDDPPEDPLPDPAEDTTDAEDDIPSETTLCETHGGTCTPPTAGCIICTEGHMPFDNRGGCTEPDWCCRPYTSSETSCEDNGGYCVSAATEPTCATGWVPSSTFDCGGIGAACCMLSDSCA